MGAPLITDISDFKRRDFTFEGKTKPVLITGEVGPAVAVIHEFYGFTPTVARLCRWVRDADFRVYAPILLGRPDATNEERQTLSRTLSLCISREFTIFAANQSSPVTDWLKRLARQAHQECGGRGVGVIGMCVSGGFGFRWQWIPPLWPLSWVNRRCRPSIQPGSTSRHVTSIASRNALAQKG
jgi:dienelactone hydrolase